MSTGTTQQPVSSKRTNGLRVLGGLCLLATFVAICGVIGVGAYCFFTEKPVNEIFVGSDVAASTTPADVATKADIKVITTDVKELMKVEMKGVATKADVTDSMKKIMEGQDATMTLLKTNHTEVMGGLNKIVEQGEKTHTLLGESIELGKGHLEVSKANGGKLDKLNTTVEKWRSEDATRFQALLEEKKLLRQEKETAEAYARRLEEEVKDLKGKAAVKKQRPPRTRTAYQKEYRTVIVPQYIYSSDDSRWYTYNVNGQLFSWNYCPPQNTVVNNYYPTVYPRAYPNYYGSHYSYYRHSYWFQF